MNLAMIIYLSFKLNLSSTRFIPDLCFKTFSSLLYPSNLNLKSALLLNAVLHSHSHHSLTWSVPAVSTSPFVHHCSMHPTGDRINMARYLVEYRKMDHGWSWTIESRWEETSTEEFKVAGEEGEEENLGFIYGHHSCEDATVPWHNSRRRQGWRQVLETVVQKLQLNW